MNQIKSCNEYKDEYYYMDKIMVANCKIFLFAKSSISNFVEYHLLEINNTRKQYNLNFVKYETFIEGLLKLMKRLNERYDNENFY